MWTLEQRQFNRDTAKAFEGLFTQGWSRVHVRGSFEQPVPGEVQDLAYERRAANVTSEQFRERVSKWGCYVPGVFGPHPTLNTELINLPWPLEFRVVCRGSELCPEPHADGSDRDMRRLDLRTGLLTRQACWQVGSAHLDLVFERFVSCVREGLIVQRATVRSSAACPIEFIAGIDARVRTNGHDHFRTVRFGVHGSWLTCRVHTDGGDDITLACTLRSRAEPPGPDVEAGRAAWRARACAAADGVVVEKLTLVARGEVSLPDPRQLPSFDALLAEHAEAMRRQWECCDVTIEGDTESQQAMRTALYHLIRAHPRTETVAIDAKGYAGEAYWGRFFWDTEAYLLPFYAHTQPELARQLCAFRVHTLEGARANAKRYGYAGARYAWESDHRGLECCPNWQYADHEVHVTADVVYGLDAYVRATGDQSFLGGPARDVVLETARYWLERTSRRAGDDRLHLLGVMGPDEYTPISSNNAYTNRMVARALELAAALADDAHEREQFAAAARGLFLPRMGKLILQCEEWPLLAEPDFDRTWPDRSRTYAAQVTQERLYRSRCLKQADVLMLMALLPHEFSDDEVAAAWREYVPYTTHDSSLSPGVHALVALRLGLADQAWAFWKRASMLDLDVAHGGAAEGIHIAACGAMWQVAVHGFAGVRPALETDVLTIDPRLPEAWKSVTFPLCWRGSRVRVHARRDLVRVEHLEGPGLRVRVRSCARELAPGGAEQWRLP